jgi:RNA polymerase sigma factor (sigma-70 family)
MLRMRRNHQFTDLFTNCFAENLCLFSSDRTTSTARLPLRNSSRASRLSAYSQWIRASREMLAADDKELGKMLVACMPMLRAFVRRRVEDREATNEILQEVSLRALSGEGPLDRASFVSWSCGIARHVIGTEWRRRRRVREEQPIDGPDLDDIRDPVSPTDQRFDARASLRRAIGDDIEGVALLFRRYLDGVSGKELATELGLTPSALRMRLMRIRSSARARSDEV